MGTVCTIKIPVGGPYPSGVKINNGAGYPAATGAAMTVDDVYAIAGDARDIFSVNQEVWAVNTSKPSNPIQFLGTCTAVGATSVRCQTSTTAFALADNAELYTFNAGALSLAKGKNTGLTIVGTPTCGLEITEDGRGQLLFTYFDLAAP
tara:strand:- start:442 stop:888 length:447 start_codon:yes stop_codon:yes gene_type:complete